MIIVDFLAQASIPNWSVHFVEILTRTRTNTLVESVRNSLFVGSDRIFCWKWRKNSYDGRKNCIVLISRALNDSCARTAHPRYWRVPLRSRFVGWCPTFHPISVKLRGFSLSGMPNQNWKLNHLSSQYCTDIAIMLHTSNSSNRRKYADQIIRCGVDEHRLSTRIFIVRFQLHKVTAQIDCIRI